MMKIKHQNWKVKATEHKKKGEASCSLWRKNRYRNSRRALRTIYRICNFRVASSLAKTLALH